MSLVEKKGSYVQARWWFILVMVLLVAIVTGYRFYKTCYSGVAYDEFMTYFRYSYDPHEALTNYDPDNASSTNNHILNSILIHYSALWFGKYESHIRLPAFVAGLIFTLSLAVILMRTIRFKILAYAGLLMISFVPFVFDYSLLARGYAFALGGIYAYLALVLLFFRVRRPGKVKFIFLLILLSLCNIVAVGAMISSAVMVIAVNLSFLMVMCPDLARAGYKRFSPILTAVLTISAFSGAGLFCLYRHILPKMTGSKALAEISGGWHGLSSCLTYMKDLIGVKTFNTGTTIGLAVALLLTLLTLFLLAWSGYKLIKARGGLSGQKIFASLAGPRGYVVSSIVISLFLLLIYGAFLNRSLGLARNQVFYIPAVVILFLIMTDSFLAGLSAGLVRRLSGSVVAVCLLVSMVNNLPSLYFFEYNISGPVLRSLRAIDPKRVWTIAFSEKMSMAYMGFCYYANYDYSFINPPGGFSFRSPGPFDVFICQREELPADYQSKYSLLDDNIYRPGNMAVLLNNVPESVRQKLIKQLIEDKSK